MPNIDWNTRSHAHERMGSEDCFVCGRSHPRGLRAAIHTDGRFAWLEATPPTELQGFDNILHGGIVTAMLDEVLWYSLFIHGAVTMTAGLEVRFRRPVVPGTPVVAEGIALEPKGRILTAQGRVRTPEGEELATAVGRFLPVPDMQRHMGVLWRERVEG